MMCPLQSVYIYESHLKYMETLLSIPVRRDRENVKGRKEMTQRGLLRPVAEHGRRPVADTRLEKALQPRFYLLALRIVDRARMAEVQATHLTWLLEQEQAGRVFLSGPAVHSRGGAPDEWRSNGFLVIRAGDATEAAALAEQEPFIAQGVMWYDLYEWTVFQGAIAVSVRISDGGGDFC